MARRRRRRSALQKLGADVLALVADAREVSKTALQQLRREIGSTRRSLEKLIAEEQSFMAELFGGGKPGRPPAAGRPRKVGRPAGVKAVVRKAVRRKGSPKADTYFAKLPKTFTIDDVRKLAGKAAPISVAQWTRSKKIKKTAKGYEKVA
jgi:hypothetical protein